MVALCRRNARRLKGNRRGKQPRKIPPSSVGWKMEKRSISHSKEEKRNTFVNVMRAGGLSAAAAAAASGGEALDGGPVRGPVHPLCCLFSRRGEEVQINRQRGRDSSSRPSTVVAAERRCCSSLWDAVRFFSETLACPPVWVSPHAACDPTLGKGLKACLPLVPSLLHSSF